jgi:hypothetical protein
MLRSTLTALFIEIVHSVCGKRSLSEEGSCFFAGHTIRPPRDNESESQFQEKG